MLLNSPLKMMMMIKQTSKTTPTSLDHAHLTTTTSYVHRLVHLEDIRKKGTPFSLWDSYTLVAWLEASNETFMSHDPHMMITWFLNSSSQLVFQSGWLKFARRK